MKNNLLQQKRRLQEGEMIRLSYDEAFKIIYANPKNIQILAMLISKILDVKYEDIKNHITLVPLEKPNRTIGEKKRERDVVVSIKNGRETRIILEMNVKRKFYETVIRRNLLYLNDVASGGIVSEGYDDLPRTILVNFNTFFIKGRQKLIDEYLFRNEEGEEFPGSDTILNLNIDECYRIWYNKEYKQRDAKERDIILLCAAMRTNKVAEFKKCLDEVRMNPEIKKLMEEEVFEMCQDENLIGRYYDKEEEEKKILKGIISEERKDAREEGFQDGFQDGVQNKQQEMILALNSEGVSIETIANASKLSKEEVKKIIAMAKKK